MSCKTKSKYEPNDWENKPIKTNRDNFKHETKRSFEGLFSCLGINQSR